MKNIAIMGATSHIAKGLIYNYSKYTDNELFLFARSIEKLKYFLKTNHIALSNIFQYDLFNDREYDVIINCIGFADPKKQQEVGSEIFTVTEHFDNLVLSYLTKHPFTKYINLSSGAVYGKHFPAPVNESSVSDIDMNHIDKKDYYRIAKINSEIKHRAFGDNYNIIDLRIFSYFSRFIDLDSSFLLAEIIRCIRDTKDFITTTTNIYRDYVHPEDLFRLVESVSSLKTINDVFDVYSLKPITKNEILEFFKAEYGLRVVINDTKTKTDATGIKDYYYSENRKAKMIGYSPRFSSSDVIKMETIKIFN